MTEQHTPGPWQWDGNVCNYDPEQEAPWLVDSNHSHPPILGGTINCFHEANARLIAAAPDLLHALKLAVRQNSHDMLMTGEELRLCESAITKATGE